MKKRKYVVAVPKPHPSAYNPDRPISDLVRNQILHLSVAERCLEKRHRSPLNVHDIKTERLASEYIHHLTRKLHERGKKVAPSRKTKRRARKSPPEFRRAKGKR